LKLPQKNLGKTLEDIANYFVNRYPVAQDISARIDKWYCIKLKKTSAHQKEKVSRVKRHPTEWVKIFASYSSKDQYLEHTRVPKI
jgi:hypothetical protein